MAAAKMFSSRALIWIMLLMAILLVLFSAAHYFTLETLSAKVDLLSAADELLPEHRALLDQFAGIRGLAGTYYVPAAGLLLILIGLIVWRIVCRLFGTLAPHGRPAVAPAAASEPESADADALAAVREERLFLHLLSVLQREGRLVDFFAEDLSLYEDGQIGAAVRTIHESCKRAADKYLALAPVVEAMEDTAYTVAADFDPSAIKLTGNVSGEPPFEGVVRHKGWRAATLDLPTFSAGRDRDTRIIAPAEIEIL